MVLRIKYLEKTFQKAPQMRILPPVLNQNLLLTFSRVHFRVPSFHAHPKTSVTKNMINRLDKSSDLHPNPSIPPANLAGKRKNNLTAPTRVIILLTIEVEKHFWLPFGQLLSPYYSRAQPRQTLCSSNPALSLTAFHPPYYPLSLKGPFPSVFDPLARSSCLQKGDASL
ncbi:hypothetical protein AVEN_211878-1 [Araneus ventricosus]|uniref:Uncharacterized protein n=1 Tax=Araneus ventricosus TaxID=182803 RepID=A0A4Y2F1E7_ARAVE|nr:hypothetical protein AVEN_211878-1 [Araneus ventricosus]